MFGIRLSVFYGSIAESENANPQFQKLKYLQFQTNIKKMMMPTEARRKILFKIELIFGLLHVFRQHCWLVKKRSEPEQPTRT